MSKKLRELASRVREYVKEKKNRDKCSIEYAILDHAVNLLADAKIAIQEAGDTETAIDWLNQASVILIDLKQCHHYSEHHRQLGLADFKAYYEEGSE